MGHIYYLMNFRNQCSTSFPSPYLTIFQTLEINVPRLFPIHILLYFRGVARNSGRGMLNTCDLIEMIDYKLDQLRYIKCIKKELEFFCNYYMVE